MCEFALLFNVLDLMPNSQEGKNYLELGVVNIFFKFSASVCLWFRLLVVKQRVSVVYYSPSMWPRTHLCIHCWKNMVMCWITTKCCLSCQISVCTAVHFTIRSLRMDFRILGVKRLPDLRSPFSACMCLLQDRGERPGAGRSGGGRPVKIPNS